MKVAWNIFKFLVLSFKFSDAKFKIQNLKLSLAAVFLIFAFAPREHAQPTQSTPVGNATDFVSEQYFEPPNDQVVKLRLTGSSATPIAGGALDIRDAKVERFNIAGKTEAIVSAPECTYSPQDNGVVSSAGHLEIRTGDGRMVTTGDGFLWRQNDNSLIISNNVHTVAKIGISKP